jgi:hypothetical protein
MNKDFDRHSEAYTNYGCIDIQFDSNFASPLSVPVADAHGIVDIDLLHKLYILFDIFIIHVNNNTQDMLICDSQIKFIK